MSFKCKIAKLTFLFWILLLSTVFFYCVYGKNLLRAPQALSQSNSQIELNRGVISKNISKKIASGPVIFYRQFLSDHWGNKCSHYPSCSHYSLLAIKKHGFYVGLVMTFDRLQHESNEARYSPLIRLNGSIKVYDPVSNNDFWWYSNPITVQLDNEF